MEALPLSPPAQGAEEAGTPTLPGSPVKAPTRSPAHRSSPAAPASTQPKPSSKGVRGGQGQGQRKIRVPLILLPMALQQLELALVGESL